MQSYYVSNNLCGCFFLSSHLSLEKTKNFSQLKVIGVHSVYGAPYSGKVILIIILLSYFFLKSLKLPVSNLENEICTLLEGIEPCGFCIFEYLSALLWMYGTRKPPQQNIHLIF